MATPSKKCGGKGRAANKLRNSDTRQPWFKQGYLMVRAPDLTAPLVGSHTQSKYIKQVSMPKNEDSLINLLTTNKDVLTFFDGRPIDYSQLVPTIKIYKVYIHDGKGAGKPQDVEEHLFPFRSFQDFKDWDSSKFTYEETGGKATNNRRFFRGKDAGIKSINIKMEGRQRNPVSANIVNVTIKFFFNDIKTLFDRIDNLKGGDQSSISYSDLIRYPPSLRKTSRSFRIRLVVGWSANLNNPNLVNNKHFLEAVKNSKLSIAADLYTHNMEFNEDGSLILTAQYKGALESAFSGQSANILGNVSPGNNKELNKMKETIRTAEEKIIKIKGSKSQKSKGRSLEEIEALTKEIARMRENIRKALGPELKGQWPEEGESQLRGKLQQLAKKWSDYNSARPTKAPFKTLTTAARGKSDIVRRSEVERNNQAKLAAMQKKLKREVGKSKPSRSQRKLIRPLAKQIRKLKRQMGDFEKSMKGKHVFEYVERMRLNNKLAWISTGRGTNFGNYKALMELLEKEGGVKSSQTKIAKQTEKVKNAPVEQKKRRKRRKKKRTKKAKGRKSVFGRNAGAGTFTDGMSFTLDEDLTDPPDIGLHGRLVPPLDKKTPREYARDRVTAFKQSEHVPSTDGPDPGKKKKTKAQPKTARRTMSHSGEAIVWKKNPSYRGGDKTYFFRLGDLLTTILEREGFGDTLAEEAPNFRVLLGEYDIPQNEREHIRMNLYDLPVSLEIFHIFVAQKIVGTGRKVYPLLQFTFDLLKFVIDKTQGVFGKAAEFAQHGMLPVSFKMDMTSVDLPTGPLKNASKENRDVIKLKNNEGNLNTLYITNINNTANAFVLHASRKRKAGETTIYNGRMSEDVPRGIFHFFVGGPNRGLLKKVNFTQAKNTLFSTALMRNGQAGGKESSREGIILPSKFACDLTLVGNPFFYIGQMFYLNTSLISGGQFEQEGILNGGYYIVTEVINDFAHDRWETKIRGVLNIPDHALKNKDGPNAGVAASTRSEEERRKMISQSTQGDRILDAATRQPVPTKNISRVGYS